MESGLSADPGRLLLGMTIHVPDELEAKLRARAQQLDVTVDELVTRELGRIVATPPRRPRRQLLGKGVLHGTGKAGVRADDVKKYLRGDTTE